MSGCHRHGFCRHCLAAWPGAELASATVPAADSSDMTPMESHLNPGSPVQETARLKVLDRDQPEKPASVQSFAGRRASLAYDEALKPGQPVELLLNDSLYLGVVAACNAAGDGFQITITLEESLQGLDGLRRLMAALLESEGGKRPSGSTQSTNPDRNREDQNRAEQKEQNNPNPVCDSASRQLGLDGASHSNPFSLRT